MSRYPATLPSTTALRVFESAARCGSFTIAADELSLTQSAVSHQIRGLESVLGVQLFERAGRGMALTEAGETYSCLLYTSPSPRDGLLSRMPSSA